MSAIKLDGKASTVTGACPTLTFVLEGKTVYTSLLTAYPKIKCDDVRNGRDLIVEGMLMSDERVRADVITVGK